MFTVRVLFPDDVVDACDELRPHVTEPDTMQSVPMSAREKILVARQLHELKKPSEFAGRKFPFDSYTAPALGITPKALKSVRSTFNRALEGQEVEGEEVAAARKALALMLEALDRPGGDMNSHQLVYFLHAQLAEGRVPESLEEARVALEGRLRRTERPRLPAQKLKEDVPTSQPPTKLTADFRRGVDAISGILVGLQAQIHSALPDDNESRYLSSELRKNVRMARQLLKILPEG